MKDLVYLSRSFVEFGPFAKKEILEHAADLSVQLATERIKKEVTPADQDRLVDRYLDQVKGPQAPKPPRRKPRSNNRYSGPGSSWSASTSPRSTAMAGR